MVPYTDFERRFAEFLANAGDILSFAALDTTEQAAGASDQAASGTSFRVNFLKPSGATGFFYPDWVAVQHDLDGEIVNWVIETESRASEGTAEKDAAMHQWCRRVSAATGDVWKCLRVSQADFRPDFATFRQLNVTVIATAMFRERDRSGACMSREEVRLAIEEGRA